MNTPCVFFFRLEGSVLKPVNAGGAFPRSRVSPSLVVPGRLIMLASVPPGGFSWTSPRIVHAMDAKYF